MLKTKRKPSTSTYQRVEASRSPTDRVAKMGIG
jgi:hypothetical protein